jgi:hypothetical protein
MTVFAGTRGHGARDEVFKDFVLCRMSASSLGDNADVDPSADVEWSNFVTLQISAHPGLSENQRRIVELDYGMTNGTADVSVRKCLLYYNLKRLGLDTAPDARRPQDQHIVLVNSSEIQDILGQRAP